MSEPNTSGWVVYKLRENTVDILGIYETREKAEADVALLQNPDRWSIKCAMFIGWGLFLADNNDKKPRGN